MLCLLTQGANPAPSLAEICAEQAPTPLLKTLHEQARWFYEYRPAAPPLALSAVFKPIIRCTPLPSLLDYQRIQIFVESHQDEHLSLDLEVAEQPEALILIGDVQPGQYSGCRLRVPANREIEVCFRIFAPQSENPDHTSRFSLKLSPVEAASELEPILSEARFCAESPLAAV